MTQDAPLDQKALEAAIAWAQEGTRDDTFSALTFDEHGALIERAIGIFLDALSRRVPASGGEYVPCIIRNDSAGFYEFVTEDVPALYGGMMAANIERIGKLQGGDLIGFRIYDETPIPEGKAEPGIEEKR